MRTWLAFILVSILVLGVVPWFIIPVFTGQPLSRVSIVVLEWCQLFIFTPLIIILLCVGIKKLVNLTKSFFESRRSYGGKQKY